MTAGSPPVPTRAERRPGTHHTDLSRETRWTTTTNPSRRIADALIGASTTTLRVQPVKPDSPSGEDIATDLFGGVAASFLSALFLMLGANALHRYYPAVAPLGYWDCWFILLGLGTAAFTVRARAWKWARR